MSDPYDGESPAAMIQAAISLIHPPGTVFEIRIPKAKGGTLSGYFDSATKAALYASKQNGKNPAIYMTVNPVKPELLARSDNQLQISQVTTTDSEIERRRWFLLDFDPVRPTGISSTRGEMHAARDTAYSVIEWLDSLGWPKPIEAMSGNGWHLMYRIDEPNDESVKSDIEFATKMLSGIFSTPAVSVDVSVYNASRIWKIYGTISAKGASTVDRPHRIASLAKVPKDIQVVPRGLIENVARALRDSNTDEYRNMAGEFIGDMVKWLADRGMTVISGPRPMFGTEGQKWVLSHCPFNKQHTDPIVGLVNNRPVYRCLHNSCSSFRWKEFREKIDPTYRDPDTVFRQLREWADGEATALDLELVQSAAALGKKLDPVIKKLKKESRRDRVLVLEDALKIERRRYLKETVGENNEKGNVVGLINRTREYQAAGIVPMYWVADYDHRIRIGTVGDVHAPKATSADEINLMIKFHSVGDSWVKQIHASQVINFLSEEYRINPLRIWLKSKKWDGVPRLSEWLVNYMGAENTEYTRAIGRKWLISAVARGMDPGCQADHMLIFEGKQGVGKSQAARIVGGDFYTEYSGGLRGMGAQKDMVAIIIGKLIVEMSELATLRKIDMESLKAMLTTTTDDARLSYERDARSYPRTCVFIGTTNEVNGSYIADATGARRFWPVRVGFRGSVFTDRLRTDMSQLWGEAVHAYEEGEDWYTVPVEEVAAQQLQRQITLEDSDPWYMKIREALTDPDSYGTVAHLRDEYVNGFPSGSFVIRAGGLHTILGVVLGIDTSRQTTIDTGRLRAILASIGFKKVRPSKGWEGGTYAYDLTRDAQPALWSSIIAAAKSAKFPMSEPHVPAE